MKILIIITLTFCLFFTFSFLAGCAKREEVVLESEEELEEEPLEPVEPEEPIEEILEEVEGEVAIGEFEWFQTGNTLPVTQLQPKQSKELEDNHIGDYWHGMSRLSLDDFEHTLDKAICEVGLKWVRLAFNSCDSDAIDWNSPEFSVDPVFDDWITSIADNGVEIMYVLSFWDKEKGDRELIHTRFKTEEDIESYLEFVKFIVSHFRDRVKYFELWNEPNCGKECLTLEECIQHITVEDYIRLTKRVVPVIREVYPEAKIVVGAVSEIWEEDGYQYLFGILNSDIIPLVDAVSWHPMYATSPEHEYWRQYYYDYSSIVQEIKDVASAHGFEGEYIVEELSWWTAESAPSGEPWHSILSYTEVVSAKYTARAIVSHLGMDIRVGVTANQGVELIRSTGRNLCTIMAGAKPTSLPVEIQIEETNIKSYSFYLSNGDTLIALWTDGIAVDEDPGVEANLTLQSFSAQDVIGIDVLKGFKQPILTSNNNGNLVIQNLIVRDYPLILHIKKSSIQN